MSNSANPTDARPEAISAGNQNQLSRTPIDLTTDPSSQMKSPSMIAKSASGA